MAKSGLSFCALGIEHGLRKWPCMFWGLKGGSMGRVAGLSGAGEDPRQGTPSAVIQQVSGWDGVWDIDPQTPTYQKGTQ